MILAVCADKGAPGVTTLALALGLVWPGQRVVLEADPAGGDLPFRARQAHGGEVLAREPSVLTLAADARGGLPLALEGYAQLTTLGVPVVPGPLTAEAYLPMRTLWPRVAQAAAGWPGTAIVDLGRIGPDHPGVALAREATAVLVLAEPTLEGLYRVRDRVEHLANLMADSSRPAVAVVVRAARRQDAAAVDQVSQVLQAAGSPVQVAGVIADDPDGAGALWEARTGRALTRSGLMRSASVLARRVVAWWPQLTPAGSDAPQEPNLAGSGLPTTPTAGSGPRSGGLGPRVQG